MEIYWPQVCEDFSSNAVAVRSATLDNVISLEKTAGVTHMNDSHVNYCNKRKCLHKKRVELPQDHVLIWSPFYCCESPFFIYLTHIYSGASNLADLV